MANSAPMIGEKGRDFAVDVVNAGYRSGHSTKLCVIGDSLAASGRDGAFGHLLRIANPSAHTGIFCSADSTTMMYTAVNQNYFDTASKTVGSTGGYDSPQTYCPYRAVEVTFTATVAGGAIAAPANVYANRLATMSLYSYTAAEASIFRPTWGDLYWHGDWISDYMDEGNGGDMTFTVFFYKNPSGMSSDRIFLQCSNAANEDVVSSVASPFSCYAVSAGMASESLTIPAAKYGDVPFKLYVRVTDDTTAGEVAGAHDGENVIICGAELTKATPQGLSWLWLSAGGSTTADWVNTAKYGDGVATTTSTWDHLPEAGITHVMISLDTNGIVGDTDASEHNANLRTLITRIRAKIPACKFCLLSPFDISATVDTMTDASYEVARQDGHCFLNVSKALPANAVLDAGLTNAWQTGKDYYAADAVTNDGKYYVCINPHTAGTFVTDLANLKWAALTTGTAWTTATGYVRADVRTTASKYYRCLIAHTSGVFATDLAAGKWIEVTVDTNEILQHMATQRNWLIGSAPHQNRNRGVALYAQAIWALLREAAEKAKMQLGEHGSFRKL